MTNGDDYIDYVERHYDEIKEKYIQAIDYGTIEVPEDFIQKWLDTNPYDLEYDPDRNDD